MHCWTTLAPPETKTSLSPAASRARVSAAFSPSVTKVKVVPTRWRGSRARWLGKGAFQAFSRSRAARSQLMNRVGSMSAGVRSFTAARVGEPGSSRPEASVISWPRQRPKAT